MRQLVQSVSGDNLMFYVSTISWLQLQQDTKWVNINFERRELTSARTSYRSTDDFGAIFPLNLIKQNVTHFSFIFLNKTFCRASEKLRFKLLLPGTVSFSTSYQLWLIRQRFIISAPSAPSPPWYALQTSIFKSR